MDCRARIGNDAGRVLAARKFVGELFRSDQLPDVADS
jgi:hypothetical protein